jgi:hypothetical protein
MSTITLLKKRNLNLINNKKLNFLKLTLTCSLEDTAQKTISEKPCDGNI